MPDVLAPFLALRAFLIHAKDASRQRPVDSWLVKTWAGWDAGGRGQRLLSPSSLILAQNGERTHRLLLRYEIPSLPQSGSNRRIFDYNTSADG